MEGWNRTDSNSEKTCWVCYGNQYDEPELEWISPCECKGATKWVHQLCLQQWVDEKQKGASSVDVSCPQCKFAYQIVYPDTNWLLFLYENVNKLITANSLTLLAGLTTGSIYWVSYSYGYATAALALGPNESGKFLSIPDQGYYVILPAIPWLIVGVKLLRLEVLLIKSWYWLTPIFYKMINKLPGFAQERVQEYSFLPEQIPAGQFVSRSILSAVTLPLFSSALGWFLSFFMDSSCLKRTFLGGLGYLLVSYTLKVWIEYHRGRLDRH